jgi:hypothetical protein
MLIYFVWGHQSTPFGDGYTSKTRVTLKITLLVYDYFTLLT